MNTTWHRIGTDGDLRHVRRWELWDDDKGRLLASVDRLTHYGSRPMWEATCQGWSRKYVLLREARAWCEEGLGLD